MLIFVLFKGTSSFKSIKQILAFTHPKHLINLRVGGVLLCLTDHMKSWVWLSWGVGVDRFG
jgi:hypothetical protein